MLDITGYKLIEKIADGGMATVWKARQLSLDRIVAIKILDRESLPDETALKQFRREARTAARLSHPNIVQVFDTGEIDGNAYLVMEYIKGESVGDMIALHGAINEARALEIIEQVCEALAYAWDKECLIHCDVNPNNILIENLTSQVKVTDLGIARMVGTQRRDADENDLIVGTPNYTAPEQSAGISDLDCRTDVYAVGATLYHMLTGLLPFHDAKRSEAMMRHEEDFLDDPVEVNPELSAPAAWLIEKFMVKNRALRPLYWTEAIEDIRRVRKGMMPNPPLPEAGGSTVRRSAKRGTAAPPSPAKKKVKLALQNKEPIKSTLQEEPATSSVGGALRNTLLLLFAAGVVYAGFYFYGRIKGKPEPVIREQPQTVDSEAADRAAEPEDTDKDGVWRNDDFIAGARLFNRALADYKAYQKDRSNPEILATVEENCREAIARFEACRDDAPDGVDIGTYITQCYGLISDVRQSTLMRSAEQSMRKEAASTEQQGPAAGAKRRVLFVDDTPDGTAEEPEPEDEPENLLIVSLNPGWDRPSAAGPAEAELGRLLKRHAVPTSDPHVDPGVTLYPGITCMMKARDAAEILGEAMPPVTAMDRTGLLGESLRAYTFTGSFMGAGQLTLVCDRNDRVVMTQLLDERPVPSKMNPSLFSSNWTVYDFVGGRTADDSGGQIAHQVRRRNGIVRIDTEVAAESEDGNRTATARAILLMPARLSGMLLQASGQ